VTLEAKRPNWEDSLKTLQKITSATATRLREIHPEIPGERMDGIVARSIIGGIVSLVGFLLLGGSAGVAGYLMIKGHTPSTVGFIALGAGGMAGLFLFGWGLVTAAGRFVKQPLTFVTSTFGGVIDIWRGRRKEDT
jgi:hypothetical protein